MKRKIFVAFFAAVIMCLFSCEDGHWDEDLFDGYDVLGGFGEYSGTSKKEFSIDSEGGEKTFTFHASEKYYWGVYVEGRYSKYDVTIAKDKNFSKIIETFSTEDSQGSEVFTIDSGSCTIYVKIKNTYKVNLSTGSSSISVAWASMNTAHSPDEISNIYLHEVGSE